MCRVFKKKTFLSIDIIIIIAVSTATDLCYMCKTFSNRIFKSLVKVFIQGWCFVASLTNRCRMELKRDTCTYNNMAGEELLDLHI